MHIKLSKTAPIHDPGMKCIAQSIIQYGASAIIDRISNSNFNASISFAAITFNELTRSTDADSMLKYLPAYALAPILSAAIGIFLI